MKLIDLRHGDRGVAEHQRLKDERAKWLREERARQIDAAQYDLLMGNIEREAVKASADLRQLAITMKGQITRRMNAML